MHTHKHTRTHTQAHTHSIRTCCGVELGDDWARDKGDEDMKLVMFLCVVPDLREERAWGQNIPHFCGPELLGERKDNLERWKRLHCGEGLHPWLVQGRPKVNVAISEDRKRNCDNHPARANYCERAIFTLCHAKASKWRAARKD